MLVTTENALANRIADEQRDGRTPSLVAAVVRDGVALWRGARGRIADAPPSDDTQYRIGSITKSFIAVLIMRLRDEGAVRLSDRLEEYVSGTSFGDRTISQLLTHQSGITAEPHGSWWERSPGRDWADVAAATGPQTIRTRADRRFHYSNLGFAALAQVVEQMRGTDWFTAARREILLPLGLSRTTYLPVAAHADGWAVHPWADVLLPEPAHDAKGMAPAGQLWSNIADLVRWAAFVAGDTGGVLSPDTVAEMRDPATLDDEDGAWTEGYGLGLQLRRDRGRSLAGHTGSMPGFQAAVFVDPSDASGAVALTNVTAGPVMGALVADLIDILATHEPKQPAEWVPMSDVDHRLLALTGPWYWGPRPYGLRLLAGNQLELVPLLGGDWRVRFVPGANDTWTALDGYHTAETLRVIRRSDGSISHLDLHTFVLTRTPYDPSVDIPGGVDSAGWRGADHLR